jgi:hypothetical protein
MRTLVSKVAALAAVALGTACGASGGNARMNVHLVDGPGPYQAINVHVLEVSIQSGTGWLTLGRPDVTVDLLQLQNGVAATLVKDAVLAPGSYGQMRLLLGDGNTVVLEDGSVHDLTVPSGMKSGLKLIVHFDVAAGETRDVFIDFDAHRSIFVHRTGASDKYILRPTIRAFDKQTTGSISGVLSADNEGVVPLAGATVTAQLLEGAAPVVAGTAVSDAQGRYQLGLLPLGHAYHVVGQPVVGGVAYAARASAPIALTAAAPTGTWSATFQPLAASGSVSGRILPPLAALDDRTDLVQVVANVVDQGAVTRAVVLRTEAPVVSATDETWASTGLPAGALSATATRRALDGTAATSGTATAAIPAAGGAVVAPDLVFGP